jgi:DNA-directed RNA polymerase subunit beta
VVRVGTRVGPGDILVGKIAPKSKSELTPEEKLLHAIFGRAGEDVKNDSLEMPAGEEGVVIGAQRFSRRMHMTDEQKKALKKDIDKYEKEMNLRAIDIFKQMIAEINEVTGTQMVDPGTRQKVGQSKSADVILEQIEGFSADWIKGNKEAKEQAPQHALPILAARAGGAEGKESPHGAHEARRRIAERRAGNGEGLRRHQAAAERRRQDGRPAREQGRHRPHRAGRRHAVPGRRNAGGHLLNPLGVPSRMNVGQILETHLGWAMMVLGPGGHAGLRRCHRR